MSGDGDGGDSVRSFLNTPNDDIVDGLFQREMVHIVAAPVGIGKTTLIMQLCWAMQHDQPWLGRRTTRARTIFITADRSRKETNATLRRMEMTELALNIVSLKDTVGVAIPFLHALIKEHAAPGDLIIVEPLNFFHRDEDNKPGKVNDFIQTAHFLMRTGKLAVDQHVTIIGTLHSSKTKISEGYAAPREKILGSVAWGAFTAGVVIIEPTAADKAEDPGRAITVLPRNSAPQVLNYMLEDTHGLLVPIMEKPGMKDTWSRMCALLAEWPVENDVTTQQILEWAELTGMSRTTAYRWTKQMVTDTKLEATERGVFRKVRPS